MLLKAAANTESQKTAELKVGLSWGKTECANEGTTRQRNNEWFIRKGKEYIFLHMHRGTVKDSIMCTTKGVRVWAVRSCELGAYNGLLFVKPHRGLASTVIFMKVHVNGFYHLPNCLISMLE